MSIFLLFDTNVNSLGPHIFIILVPVPFVFSMLYSYNEHFLFNYLPAFFLTVDTKKMFELHNE